MATRFAIGLISKAAIGPNIFMKNDDVLPGRDCAWCINARIEVAAIGHPPFASCIADR
jgi:hypothetical protein